MQAENNDRWYAVHTQSRKEKLALNHLERQGFDSFCPYHRVSKRSGKKYSDTLLPFFPNYLFVRMDLAQDRWRSVNGTVGVRRLVQFGGSGAPDPMPVGLVERFQELSVGNGEISFTQNLSPGDRVRISEGPFAEMYGTLVRADGLERVTILLNILSGETKVELDRRSLVRV